MKWQFETSGVSDSRGGYQAVVDLVAKGYSHTVWASDDLYETKQIAEDMAVISLRDFISSNIRG